MGKALGCGAEAQRPAHRNLLSEPEQQPLANSNGFLF
jgi:hypothetical protein